MSKRLRRTYIKPGTNSRLEKLIDRVRQYDDLRKKPRVSPTYVKGDGNEDRALHITKSFLEKDEIPLNPKREVQITTPFSLSDKRGYDLIVPTDRGDVGIQIKSSRKYQDEFFKKHPDIPCVVVNEYVSDERIYIEIGAAIHYLYSKLQ